MSNNYILPTGKNDDNRLTLQSKSLEPITHTHIYRAGLRDNFIVADIGCGNGEMVLWFLGKVAMIYAIDISEEQLELTKQKVESTQIKHSTIVKYIKLDISNEDQISDLVGIFDMVFMRVVLMHIPTTSHNKTINNLMQLLKTGGKIISEEAIWDHIYCNHHEEIVNNFKSAMFKEAENNKLDYNIGSTVNQLFESAGFQVDEYQVVCRDIAPTILIKMFNSLVEVLMNKTSDPEIKLMYKDWIDKMSSITDDTPGLIMRTSSMSLTTCTKP